MKITKTQLKQIIKEELSAVMEETPASDEYERAAELYRQRPNPFLDLPKASDKEAYDYFVNYVTHPVYGLSTDDHNQTKAYYNLIEWMKQYPNVFKDYLEDRKDVYDLISKGQVEARAQEWKKANPGKKLSKMEPPRLKGHVPY